MAASRSNTDRVLLGNRRKRNPTAMKMHWPLVHCLSLTISEAQALTLVLTVSEVRRLLYNFSIIGRDLLVKSASKAEMIAMPEEKLRDVDQNASNDQFITEDGRVAPLAKSRFQEWTCKSKRTLTRSSKA